MMTTMPVTITPAAAARIAELGIRSDVERMIDHAGSSIADLESIQVSLYDRYDLGEEPGLCIDLYSRRPYDRMNTDEQQLIRWLVSHFSPDTLRWILMDYHPGQSYAR
jgi:hypothetical protein